MTIANVTNGTNPPILDQLLASGDPGAEMAALAVETGTTERKASSEARQAYESAEACEDQKEVLQFASEVLRSYGYRVIEAEEGEQALATGCNLGERIDLLVSDVIMPKMRGTELARRLRAMPGMGLFRAPYHPLTNAPDVGKPNESPLVAVRAGRALELPFSRGRFFCFAIALRSGMR